MMIDVAPIAAPNYVIDCVVQSLFSSSSSSNAILRTVRKGERDITILFSLGSTPVILTILPVTAKVRCQENLFDGLLYVFVLDGIQTQHHQPEANRSI